MTEGKEIIAAGGREPAANASPARLPFWIWPHLLSLDAPLVAVGWQAWWAEVSGVRLDGAHHAILGLSVWMIYLADRLVDSLRASPAEWGTLRHAFYHRQRGPAAILLGVSLAALVVLTLRGLTTGEFAGGAILLAVAGGYFWQIHGRAAEWWCGPKEAAVAGLFAAGVGYFVAWRGGASWRLAVGVGLFGAECFLNCALITRWERTLRDRRDPSSLLNAFPRLVERLGVCAGALAAVVGAVGVATGQSLTFAPLMLAAIALWMLDLARARIPVRVLRVLADAALLTPWAFLLRR